MYISQLELLTIFEKGTEFKKGLQFAPTTATVRFKASVFFWRHQSSKPVIFIRSRCPSLPEGSSSESYAGGNEETLNRMVTTKRTP